MSLYYRYYFIYKTLLNAKNLLMEAKKVEMITFLLAGFKKTEVSKQLDVSRKAVHRMKQRLKASVFLKDRPRSGRPQIVSQKAIKKAFENDPCRKMTRLAQKKNISVSPVYRMVKNIGGEKVWEVPETSCLVQRQRGEHPFVEWLEESQEFNFLFFTWENIHPWFCLQQTKGSGFDVREWNLWTPQSDNY